MSALAYATAAAPAARRIALLGAGGVGGALLQRLARLAPRSADVATLQLAGVANSRRAVLARGALDPAAALARLAEDGEVPHGVERVVDALGTAGPRVVIDATGSDALAARHAEWLGRGLHVVTASKLGLGAGLERFHAIRGAAARGGARYGDAATVGAGLPLLRTLARLRRGGDEVVAIAGVLSGSLAWLFAHYDGMRPFSAWLREAQQRGYTEPDARDDLSGADVRRKLLILARSAGHALEESAVDVESLVPPALARLPAREAREAWGVLDAPLRARVQAAYREGRRLRYVARFEGGRARVGLEALAPDDPLAQGGGCDNRVAFRTDRYRERPLLVQGPGAGNEVTAAALLDDVLECLA